jgi:putative flippase GtrA
MNMSASNRDSAAPNESNWLKIIRTTSWMQKASSHIPPAQFGRYLIVGTFNTLFGYLSYAALTAWLAPRISLSYVVAMVLSTPLNITIAFLGYKWFVFRTRGNYLREWARCFAVYMSGTLIALVLLPILVAALHYGLGLTKSAPYVAGATLTAFGVLYNFFGHKRFSFRSGI